MGYQSAKCYATSTKNWTTLPQAPWKVSAGNKHQRELEEEPALAAKVQKISAAEAMDIEPANQNPLWEDNSKEDF